MRLLNAEEMRQVEQHAAKFGLSYQRMMENAGAASARNIRNVLEKGQNKRRNVCVVCGKGNNGGDGFVVARKLNENGYAVTLVLANGYPQSPESVYMYKTALEMSIQTVWYDADKVKSIQTIRNSDVIVDCIFGFGFYGTVSDELAMLFDEINRSPAVKFSVDVPSGVYCDSGLRADHAVKADYTIAISSLKPAHVMYPAAENCGNIIVVNIGIPDESFGFVENTLYTYSPKEIKGLFPERSITGNKGTFGHVMCICGSRNMVGAAYLSTEAALKSGAGLVTAAFPECMYIPLSSKLTESLMLPLEANPQGTLSAKCIPTLLEKCEDCDAILIGCGLGVNDDTVKIVEAVISSAKCPVIIDADGINAVSTDINMLRKAAVPIVLTPHPGEMSRLIKVSVDNIQADRVAVARNFAESYLVTLALKGSNTVVATGGSDKIFVNSTGNTGLSKGGSGDLLAGLIAGFIAQGMTPVKATSAAVYIHGYLGETVSAQESVRGMLPSDMLYSLPKVLADFE
ncbi:MAG: NAD(P)H-hydrate dehydratase [Acutalibacteraceae bacterium]|nr:NAD(P)H-hydrate dehydratase [Oscillospiraceae bacterium]